MTRRSFLFGGGGGIFLELPRDFSREKSRRHRTTKRLAGECGLLSPITNVPFWIRLSFFIDVIDRGVSRTATLRRVTRAMCVTRVN